MIVPNPIPDAARRLAATHATLLPEHKPAGTRGVILEVALKLFAEHGYAGASIREIADGAGMRPASLYAHYPSKEHILAELCRIGHEEHRRSIQAALLECGADPRDQVVAYVHAHVAMHAQFSMLAVVANGELHALSSQLGAATFELRNQSIQALMDIVQRGVERGVFNVPDVWLAVAAIGAMGMRVAYWYTPEYELGAHRVAEIYAQYALRVLGAPES
ncbi:MAG: TetR/AcrR family transcriptional regulator [Pseudomonadota bacterium]|jgi:AcrR family transcriptional regulator|nr:TetR/AcrR family transcriptional regulator [Pseudomonadota bacterium]